MMSSHVIFFTFCTSLNIKFELFDIGTNQLYKLAIGGLAGSTSLYNHLLPHPLLKEAHNF